MTDIMGRAWLLRGLLLALLVTAGPAELEERNGSEENAFGMFGKFFVPAKMERPSATTKPAATSPVTAWPSPPISATKAPSPTAATTTPGPTTLMASEEDGSPLQSAMTEFFRTSTPKPLVGSTTTPAPFTLADNTLLGGLNTTAPLRFGNRKLIAVTELAKSIMGVGWKMHKSSGIR